MKLLVCGSRGWEDKNKIRQMILSLLPVGDASNLVIHGGARGADRLAGEVAWEHQIPTQVFKAEWEKYGKQAGVLRNEQMLKESKPDIVLAFLACENSKGTEHMIKIAKEANVPVIEVKGYA